MHPAISSKITRAWIFAIVPFLNAVESAEPVFEYHDRIGFYDEAHRKANGRHYSYLTASSHNGHFGGSSAHFVGTFAPPADPNLLNVVNQTAWLYRIDGLMMRVGLYGYANGFASSSGAHDSRVELINGVGESAGRSAYFEFGETPQRWIGWRADQSGNTRGLGFLPTMFTNNGTLVGQTSLTGPSQAYMNFASGGDIPLGQFPEAPYSWAADVNDSNYVVGYSQSFDGVDYHGWGAWLRHPNGTYTKVGLTGPEYVTSEEDTNRAFDLSSGNWITGVATVERPGSSGSRSMVAWQRTPAGATRRIGVFDPALHLNSTPDFLTDDGYVFGSSQPVQQGHTLWVANPDGVTHTYDLGDDIVPERPTAYTFTGYAIGPATTTRGAGGIVSYMLHKRGGVRVPTLRDWKHVRSDGYVQSRAEGISEEAIVWGSSVRYLGTGAVRGQTAWVYNAAARALIPLEISVRPADGYSWTRIERVLKDGTAIGSYARFVGNTATGRRGFTWKPGQPVVKIDVNMDVSVNSAGWTYFENAEEAGRGGYIAGTGVIDPTLPSQGVYVVRKLAASE